MKEFLFCMFALFIGISSLWAIPKSLPTIIEKVYWNKEDKSVFYFPKKYWDMTDLTEEYWLVRK